MIAPQDIPLNTFKRWKDPIIPTKKAYSNPARFEPPEICVRRRPE
jgi:hypothetical protein